MDTELQGESPERLCRVRHEGKGQKHRDPQTLRKPEEKKDTAKVRKGS